jgi:hypothetical protein
MSAVEEWIKACEDLQPGQHFPGGQFFPGDEDYLKEVKQRVEPRRRFTANEEDLNGTRNGRFHFDLGAIPYVGNLRTAQIFLLMINPGVNNYDYEDLRNHEVQCLFERNRHQKLDYCFAFKKSGVPKQAWTPYFARMFGGLINSYPQNRRDCFLNKLAKSVAILELVPYFSQRATLIDDFHITNGKRTVNGSTVEGLPSARLAIRAAHEIASKSENLIIFRWKKSPERWELVGERENCVISTSMSGLTEVVKQRIRLKLQEIDPECC